MTSLPSLWTSLLSIKALIRTEKWWDVVSARCGLSILLVMLTVSEFATRLRALVICISPLSLSTSIVGKRTTMRRKRKLTLSAELGEQHAYFQWLSLKYPNHFEMTFHVPNEGKRNPRIARMSGIKAGVPDIFMMIPNQVFHGLCIEMKKKPTTGSAAGKVTKGQKKMIDALNQHFYFATACWGCEEAINVTERYIHDPGSLYVLI
jgi:hypothetical protein